MMFEQNFMPEGAEINPDTPRKKGLARLFEILSRDLDGIFLSGALAMLVCVPAAILAGIALWLGGGRRRVAGGSGSDRTVRYHPACLAG